MKKVNIAIELGIFELQSWTKRWSKFTKLSKIGFSMEYFTANLLQFFTEKRQNLAFGWTAGQSPSNPSIVGIFLKFPNFLRS